MKRIGLNRPPWCDVRLDLVDDTETISISYSDEADLSLGIATVAHLHGWHVEREVVIPGWGRLDLWLTEASGTRSWSIELKLRLDRPALVRKAFQQAEGYRRWLIDDGREPFGMVLAAPDANCNQQLIAQVGRLYPSVRFVTGGRILNWLTDFEHVTDEFRLITQREEAHRRLVKAQREVALRAQALNRLPHPSPELPVDACDVLDAQSDSSEATA